jgi:glutathione synthase/RimK-type ligase-like ATP-grasp enzyme
MHLHTVGVADSPRVLALQQACASEGWGFSLSDWREILAGFQAPVLPTSAVLRLESLGESAASLLTPHLQHGELAGSAVRFSLLKQHFQTLQAAFSPFSSLWMNDLDSILLCFDKLACQQHLAQHGIPQPTLWGEMASLDRLQALPSASFVKLRYGSSASGVVALRKQGSRWLARTTVQRQHGTLFNHLQPQTYTDQAALDLLATLLPERVIAQSWLPKLGLDGKTLDVRVLCLGQKVAHIVVRMAESPITNLHLGAHRQDGAWLQSRIRPRQWQALHDVAEAAARALPKLHYVGLDLLLHQNQREVFVIEANALGDYLPTARWQGLNPWQAELRMWQA